MEEDIFNVEKLDSAINLVLRASGSNIKYYTMQKSLDEMREAMKKIVYDAYLVGKQEALKNV